MFKMYHTSIRTVVNLKAQFNDVYTLGYTCYMGQEREREREREREKQIRKEQATVGTHSSSSL